MKRNKIKVREEEYGARNKRARGSSTSPSTIPESTKGKINNKKQGDVHGRHSDEEETVEEGDHHGGGEGGVCRG